MTQWLLSVAGIAILSVLSDIVLPNGVCRKYIKTVVAIVVTLVVAQPVFSLVSGKGFFADYREKQSVFSPQESYLAYVETMNEADVNGVYAALVAADFQKPQVTFSANKKQYAITFSEARSSELERRAEVALKSAEVKFPAVFYWSNTE